MSIESNDKPNVVLIIMDATRTDHLSCYGYYRETAPNLEALAGEGVLFENAISAAPWTLPSITSMFTGTYPSRHGNRTWHNVMDDGLLTLAQILSSQGYNTAAFHSAGHIGPSWGTDRGFQQIRERLFQDRNLVEILEHAVVRVRDILTNSNDCGAAWTNNQVQDWITDCHEPFLLYLHYMEPHVKYRSPWPYHWQYLNDPSDWIRSLRVNRRRTWLEWLVGQVTLEEADFEILTNLYDGAINYLDKKIGEVVGMLRQRCILDNSILIITADHGENLGDHGMMGHQWCLYETLIKVPLIIRYPKIFPPDLRISGLVQTVDILPTLIDILQITPAELSGQLQGQSVISEGRICPRRRYGFAEEVGCGIETWSEKYPEFDFSPYKRELRAVRTDRYKYIWSSNGQDELYDLVSDPNELHNLSAEFPAEVNRLSEILQDWHQWSSAGASAGRTTELDEIVEQRLRDLGYLG